MLNRKIKERISTFFRNQNKALLITGARQTGKTYIVRQYARGTGKNLIEINFLESEPARHLCEGSGSSKDLLTRISLLSNIPMKPNDTIIFFDEVQECREIMLENGCKLEQENVIVY